MGIFDDVSGFLGMPTQDAIAGYAGSSVSLPSTPSGSVTNKDVVDILSKLYLITSDLIQRTKPRYLLDPSGFGEQGLRDLRDRIEQLKSAAESYPPDGFFPLMSDLQNVRERVRVEIVAAGEEEKAREKISEQLKTDITDTATGIIDTSVTWIKIAVIVAGAVAGYLIYREFKK